MRSGVALLEVIVALTILTVAGASLSSLVLTSAQAVTRAQDVDKGVAEASAFMDAVVLWTRADLDRRLGDRRQGEWRLRIERPLATLYVITLTDSSGTRELLRSSVYRPEVVRASP